MIETKQMFMMGFIALGAVAAQGCGTQADTQTAGDDEVLYAIDASGIRARGEVCGHRCIAKAREVFADCVAGGADRAECRETAVKGFRACAESCPDDPPACDEGCRRFAHNVGERCLAAGGAPERCRDLAEGAGRLCVARCADNDPPTCGDRCKSLAHALYDRCVEAGGSADDCEARAREAGGKCMDRCRAGR